MFLVFPDLDSLRLAITSGVVPTAISLAPASAAVDDQGRAWLEPSVPLPRGVQNELRKLGVQAVKANDQAVETISCWPQLLPVQRLTEPALLSGQAPVLFDLPDADQLPELVSEMLRLGNDRQSFRYLENGEQGRVLLRVVGPPYYSLLRALENDRAGLMAYVEKAPRVWVALGYSHALIEQIQPAAGQVVLLQPPRTWTFLDDAPFRDIYDILELQLPQGRVRWNEGELKRRLTVPLRLVPGGGTEQAELWVLRRRPLEQLDALVRDADNRLLARLSFAVVEDAAGTPTTIVLRARPSNQALPVLVLDAESFRPYLKLPNLYLPSGSRLGPPLRRDAVRKLLADDPDRVSWLYPQGDGRFTPESLTEGAFRPLEHWIDYVLDHDRAALEAWIGSTRFDFEAFICSDDQPVLERKKEKGKGKKERDETRPGSAASAAAEEKQREEEKRTRSESSRDDFIGLPRAEPSELARRLQELEQQFLDLTVPLDAPERQDLWRELALVNTALGNPIDANVCWAHSFWEDDEPAPARLRAWFEAEARARHGNAATRRHADQPEKEVEHILDIATPTEADLRTLAAYLAWAAASQAEVPLARIQRFLEEHEGLLSVRGFWLAWVSLVQLSRGDVLALARARDRLLERLYLSGLNPEQDVPSFVKDSGQRSREGFRGARERLVHLHELARLWCETYKAHGLLSHRRDPHTDAYIDLMFAFGLARLGEIAASDRLLHQAAETLGNADEVDSFLLEAFTYRVKQVKDGKPHAGSLPPEQLEYLEDMHMRERQRRAEERDVSSYKDRTSAASSYVIEKLRERSTILEPHDKFNAYRRVLRRMPDAARPTTAAGTTRGLGDSLENELALLSGVTDHEQLKSQISRLLQAHRDQRAHAKILVAALQVAPRLGDAFSTELLLQVPPSLDKLPYANDPQMLLDLVAPLIDRGILVAGHYDRRDLVYEFASRFVSVFEALHKARTVNKLSPLLQQWFRGLRKFGLRDEMDRWLQQMDRIIRQDQNLTAVRERYGVNWPTTLTTLLYIAAGWFYFGRNDQALPILDAAREQFFSEDMLRPEKMPEKKALAVAYCNCLGQAPIDLAFPRFEEFFRKVGIGDNRTTIEFYSIFQLEVVEAVVLAVASDDFTLGSEVRRWLEDDEFLVRRRIHRDLKAFMAQAGM